MPKKQSKNDNLHAALRNKNDEFYTLLEDVKAECEDYKESFKNKIIYCNTDDEQSAFWKYFYQNFRYLQLKKIIATHLEEPKSYKLVSKDGENFDKIPLQQNGGYETEECLKLLQESDIVITNPPFSLSKQFIDTILSMNKKILVIGNENSFSSTLLFPYFKDQLLHTGNHKVKQFLQPDGSIKTFGNICWLTNLPNQEKPFLLLTKSYKEESYPKYDNFDAINVDKIVDIPKDYDGIMGVPISIVGKYNPKQFEILGLAAGNTKNNKLNYKVPYTPHPLDRGGCGVVNGVRKYTRVFIQKRKEK